ncbi:MAG: iron permease, partial [Sphingomonadaceae bacterium]
MAVLFHLRSLTVLLAVLGVIVLNPTSARAEAGEVQTVWRLLDYVAVDYAGAVSNGRVTSTAEYAEMTEFSATIRSGLAALPAKPERARLVAEAESLQAAIGSKTAPDLVAQKARSLASDLLAAYP